MVETITAILPFISPSALPLVIVILGGIYIYRKIGNERKETKVERDKDSQDIHDKILKLDFEVTNIKGNVGHHQEVLEDLRNQINVLNMNIVKLTVSMENLVKNLENK